MIGLGSNRMSVCRRGGMSVTQAGRGGMEWLLGFRAPSWASPYSVPATAALKAAFPTQWPTIRDYGFAHPEIVPYVNQYPMIAASLAGVARCVMTTNGEAYFNTGIKNSNAKRIEVEAYFNEQNRAFIGARNGSRTSDYAIGWDPTQKIMYDLATTRISVNAPAFVWHILVLDRKQRKGYLDGAQVATFSSDTISVANDLFLMTMNNGGGTPTYWSGSGLVIASAKILEGTTEHHYIPCEDNKIIDVATGNVITKSGSGTATFSIDTPAA